MHPLSAKALVPSGFQRVLFCTSYKIRSSKFPKYRGVDTMCAVGANGCIVGASMGAYQIL